jgi:(2R)-sulfolactate sulfo-lyase subunit beta
MSPRSSCSGRPSWPARNAASTELWISTKCGESTRPRACRPARRSATCTTSWIPRGVYGVFGETSEITGAEHLCKARAATPEVGERWYKMWKAYQDDVIEAHKTDDLSDSQPTKGNIAGGLTTIEEKALGNLEKIGRECKFIDILEPAEAPAKGPGLYYMDTSSAAAECVTLMAAGGYVMHTFPTGQGNVIGNPIVPVIKITGNPKTMRTMPEHIDVDVSGVLRRDHDHPAGGRRADREHRAHREWAPHRSRKRSAIASSR